MRIVIEIDGIEVKATTTQTGTPAQETSSSSGSPSGAPGAAATGAARDAGPAPDIAALERGIPPLPMPPSDPGTPSAST